MTEKKTTKKEIEDRLETIEEELELTKQQLVAVSEGYQNLLNANGALNGLVMKYEETINILTARLIEARPQG